MELHDVVELEALPSVEGHHLSQDGIWETGSHRITAHDLLVKVFTKRLVRVRHLLPGNHLRLMGSKTKL